MTEQRLYGNWLRPQSLSIRGVGWKGALFAIGAYLSGLVVAQYDPRAGFVVLALCAVVTVASATRVGGATLSGWTVGKARWLWARHTRRTSFRAITPNGWALPGLLAQTRMLRVGSGGREYGAIHDPTARRVAVTLRAASTAADLTDLEQHDAGVGRWERWLEGLGRRPEVAWVSVTVETAPSPGTQLRDMVTRRIADRAPADCRSLMHALVDTSPGVAARTDTRVTVTFDLRAWDAQVGWRARREGIAAYLPVLDRAVGGLESTLDGCGVTVLGRATPDELSAVARVAFDPASSGDVELAMAEARGDIPEWEYAGPVAADELPGAYRHDSGISVSFAWSQAPRQLVTSTVLDAIARPGRHRKRFTCTYLATPTSDAMDAATAQVRWRWFAQMISRLPVIGRATTAQDERDAAAAEQATHEVAAGAGWVAQTVAVTVTVLDNTDLAAAVAEVEHAAGASQLRLRQLFELQAAGFLAGLPAGLSLTELARRWSR